MQCPRCHLENPDGSEFCNGCGRGLLTAKRPNIVLTILGIALLLVLLLIALNPGCEKTSVMRPTDRIVTRADYALIETGMSYAEVCAIVERPGEEISRSDIAGISTVMYAWRNPGGSNMNAMFQNDRLVTKAQFGLP